ncbi:MAG: PKD domain-containing protein, partial [Candidatus Rokuibacteriota bacterium]
TRDLRATTTDGAGHFAFPGVSPGHYALTATAADHLAGTKTLRIPSSSPQAETTLVDIDLTPTGAFLGEATLENATNHQSTVVYVDGTSYVAATNSAGAYSIAGVPVGTWTLKATHPGYVDQSTAGSIAAAGDSVSLPPMVLPIDSNIPPTAIADPPTNAVATLAAQFTGSGSDPDGMVVLYEWDFEDDGVFDTADATSATASHVYPVAGPTRAKLRVTDDKGAIGLDVVSFQVELPPGVYVSATTGSAGSPGTPAEPVPTIGEGFALAQVRGGPIYIAEGTYAESVTMASGVDLLGGYEPANWTRDPAQHVTTVTLGSQGLRGIGVSDVTIEGLVIQSADATVTGESSYGVFLSGSSSIVLRDCEIEAGSGAAGSAGSNGQAGLPGGSGGPGQPGCENSGGFCD